MKRTVFAFLLVLLSRTAMGEQVAVTLPESNIEEQKVPESKPSIAVPLFASIAATVASGGKVIFFPLLGSRDVPVLYQKTTSGLPLDAADESFRILRHTSSFSDERIEAEKTAEGLTRGCPSFPARVIELNGAFLVERESTDCYKPGYRYTLSRYLKGSEGFYQTVYLARSQPSERIREEWKTALSNAKVVP